MKKTFFIALLVFFVIGLNSKIAHAQATPLIQQALAPAVPWSDNEVIQPSTLAAELKNPDANTPLIYNIGAVEDIKSARHIGAVGHAENLEKFKTCLTEYFK